MNEPVPGRVVVSRAGHDKGRPLVVLSCEENGLLVLADGRTRTVGKPKRKKRKTRNVSYAGSSPTLRRTDCVGRWKMMSVLL